MSKRKSKKSRFGGRGRPASSASDLALMIQRAMRALESNDFDRAWTTWQGIDRTFPGQQDLVRRGLNETSFRQALAQPDLKLRVESLQAAIQQFPDDARFPYHLALAQHRMGQLEPALDSYQAAHQLSLDPRRLAYPWALAALEAGNAEHLALARPLVTDPEQQAALDAVIALRRKKLAAPRPLDEAAGQLDRLWIGLAHLARGEKPQALAALRAAAGDQPLPDAAESVRRYYLGVLAAGDGDLIGAADNWVAAYDAVNKARFRPDPGAALFRNLGYLHRQRAIDLLDEGGYKDALEEAAAASQLGFEDRILAETGALAGFYLGNQAAERGDWTKAQEFWQMAYDASPSRHLALNLGLAYERVGDWHEAAVFWRDMARRRPRKEDHPDYLDDDQVAAVWARSAACYVRSDDVDEALAMLRNALKYAPDDANLRLDMARMQLAVGSDWAAQNTVNDLLAHQPKNVAALMLGAQISASSGDRRQAKRYWQQALAIEPDNEDVIREYCAFCEQQGDDYLEWGWNDQALDWYRQGLAVAPTHGELLASVALVLARQDDREGALDHARRAIEHGQGRSDGYFFAIRALMILGEQDEALAAARLAGERIPYVAPGFFLDMAGDARIHGQTELFDALIGMAEAVALDKLEFWQMAGTLLIVQEQYDLAEVYLSKLLEAAPDHLDGLMMLGVVYAETERKSQAKNLWRTAKRLARKASDHARLNAVNAIEDMFDSGMPKGSFAGMLAIMSEGMIPGLDDDEEFYDEDDDFPGFPYRF